MIHRNGTYSEFRGTEGMPEASIQLEKLGYAVVPQIFSQEEIAELKNDVDRIFDGYPVDGRSPNRSVEEDEHFRYEMLNRSAVCQRALGKAELLEVIEPLIGEDCHVIANTAWRNPANFNIEHGGGSWHIDAGPHVPLAEGMEWPAEIPHPVFAIGVHIYLQDCAEADGPTGVIPGSHLSGRYPPRESYFDPGLSYKGKGVVPLICRAGDVGLFVSDVWHRRMPTTADDSGRYFLQVHYGRRDIAQRIRPTAEVNHLSSEAIERATTERERQLIGLHRNLFYDG
jgi:ectoine hydroxylase-related dioxygenase (phytanoyl-CoA dioxygenase family)